MGVTLLVRSKPGSPKLPTLDDWQNIPLRDQTFLTPDDYARLHGAAEADLDRVEAFAKDHGLAVVERHAGRRSVVVEGAAAAMEAAFGVALHRFEAPLPTARRTSRRGPDSAGTEAAPAQTHVHHGYDGAISLPPGLHGVVLGVFGLDDRRLSVPAGGTGDPAGAVVSQVPTVAGWYNFPNTGAADQTIGVHAPSPAAYLRGDITGSYFPGLSDAKYQTAPGAWNDIALTVSGTQFTNNTASVSAITSSTPNATLNSLPDSFILELTQDISTSATIAQGATVNVYFTQDSEQGWITFLNRVLQPQAEPQPTVLTSSFPLTLDDSGIGSPATSGTTANAMGTLFQALGALGIQLFSAIGDWGSNDQITGGLHVAYPSSDPFVTACGGTVLSNSPSFLEYVWSDAFNTTSPFGGGSPASSFGTTGGGVSNAFTTAPAYQTAIGVTGATDSGGTTHTGRGVPDIAGMVAYSGFFVNGVSYPYTGTSCVAPLYAGLAAVLRSAFGRSLGPLNTLFYQVPQAFNDVVTGNNDSADATGDSPYYTAGTGWDACTGLGSIDGAKMVKAIAGLLYSPNWYFQVNKGSYGLDEVQINATYNQTLWLALEGYTPNQVTTASLKPTVTVVGGGINVDVNAPVFELATALDTPQRILFPCTVTFLAPIGTVDQNGLFPDPNQSATQVLLSSIIHFQGSRLSADTVFELEAGADPYFFNYNVNGAGIDGQGFNSFYLSPDLRVFTVTPGINATPIAGVTLNVPDPNSYYSQQAYTYIASLLSTLNSQYHDPTKQDPFSLFPDQSNAASGDSSVTPTVPGPSGQTWVNYNFAVARVRLTGANGSSTGLPVKVFFRLFAAETSDTDYQPAGTYLSNFVGGLPESPLPGVDNITLPFFATGNYDTTPVNADYSATSINNQPIVVQTGTQTWAYYGCYLNIYAGDASIGGTAIQKLLPSTHSCLVAQIAYDNSPIPTGNQVVGPENYDKLAQRNLQVTTSDNPGPAEAHRVPQTFDLRPTGALSGGGGLGDYPDELMIDWGKTPPGSIASIYWPAVAATDVLTLAGRLYATHQLSAADPHTVRCVVPDGLTFVPVPPGIGENIAGLFTVDLPMGVQAGQTYLITVRRLSTRRGEVRSPPPPPPPPPRIAGHAALEIAPVQAPGVEISNTDWRFVVGSFAVRIPVTTAAAMRPVEENTLAIMRWRLKEMNLTNRWHPVLKRYIGYLEGRVRGVHGDPGAIAPSQWGIWGAPARPGTASGPPHRPGRPGRPGGEHGREHTGKVEGLIFDRFGDFEGFLLRDKRGEEHYFRSREAEIEALAHTAWRERQVISVFTDEDEPDVPALIVLRRAPPQPRPAQA
jgi:hypothetical protein